MLLFDWFQRLNMEPITDDLSKQNMFFVEMERVYPLNWLNNRFDWLADSINLTSQASSGPTFRKRLLSMDCVDVRYHFTLTCKVDFTWMLNVKFNRDDPLLLSFSSLKLSIHSENNYSVIRIQYECSLILRYQSLSPYINNRGASSRATENHIVIGNLYFCHICQLSIRSYDALMFHVSIAGSGVK